MSAPLTTASETPTPTPTSTVVTASTEVTPTATPTPTCTNLPYHPGGPVIEPCNWTGPAGWPSGFHHPPHIVVATPTCTDLPIHVGGPAIEPCNFPPKGGFPGKPNKHSQSSVKVVPVVTKAAQHSAVPVARVTKIVSKPVVPTHALANTGSEVAGTAMLGAALILSGIVLSIKSKSRSH